MKVLHRIFWSTFLAVFIATHLVNFGHQPGSVSEYAVRPFGWLGTLIFLSLAALLLSAAAMVGQNSTGIWGKTGATLQVLAALILVGVAVFPMDPIGHASTTHGHLHSTLAPIRGPLATLGSIGWWADLRSSSAGSLFRSLVPVLAIVGLLAWAAGFIRLPGAVFAIDQRLFFLLVGGLTT